MSLELNVSDTVLLVIDVQERLAPSMNPELLGRMISNLERLGAARTVLDLPAVVTEQYPKGLGPTIDPVDKAFAGVERPAKVAFDAYKDDAIRAQMDAMGRNSVLLTGMEAHICVYQTARSLVAAGFSVHVLVDGIASRTSDNYQVGLKLMERAGAVPTSTETVLFDLLGQAGTDAFKAISKLVK